MVIYNHKKEFVGIEEKDLRALKLSSLAELQNEAADFADLFVKTPGHIHNFKHVHWLDFIGSADSIDENRVIISVKGRNFKATIELRTLFLVDDPEREAYGVVLSGIRELTKEENERISGDLAQRNVTRVVEPAPVTAAEVSEPEPKKEEIAPSQEIVEDPYAAKEAEEEPLTLDLDLETPTFEETQEEATSYEEEAPLEISLEEETSAEESVYVSDEEDKFADYHYDPELAAKELGLPTDLVEEFIQDFIAQAHEFKPELYEALDAGRIDNLRMLSHKLKGVAANLRIEDAYDALVTINTSDDVDLVKHTLDRFYNFIIKKLAGEEVKAVSVPQAETPKQEQPQEETISLDLEDEITLETPNEEENTDEIPQLPEEEEKIELDLDEDLFAEEEERTPQPESQQPEEEKLELDLEVEEQEENEAPLELALDEDEEQPLELVLDEEKEEENNISLPEEESEEEEPVELFQESEEVLETEKIEIDKEHIASELGIDPEAYDELLGDYVSDMHGGLAQLEEAIESGDDESAKKLALRLKGMSDNMHLNDIAEELEHFIKDEAANKGALVKKIKMQIDSIEGI